MEDKCNKKRCVNFTSEEENLLVALVEKYKDIVESKKTGSTTWADKEKGWKKIEEEFNSLNGRNSFRSVKNLKEKYNNLKKRTKKRFSENRLNTLKTGGGEFTPILISDVDNAIKNIIGTQIDGMENKYDSDNVVTVNPTIGINSIVIPHLPSEGGDLNADTTADVTTCLNEHQSLRFENTCNPQTGEDIIVEMSADDNTENLSETGNWSTYNASMLRQPVSDKLKSSEGNRKTPKLCKSRKIVSHKVISTKKYLNRSHELIEEKINFLQFQKQKFEEEHQLKMKLLHKKVELVEKKLSEN